MRNFNLEPMQHCCDYQLTERLAFLKVHWKVDYLQAYGNLESIEEAS